MALAKKNGRDDIDAWTNNGYGISVEADNSKEEKEKVEELNKELRSIFRNKEK